jgi:hypothetical protein
MKKLFTLGVLSLAILALVTFAPSASAATVGQLSVQNCSGGGVVVTISLIDWQPATQCLAAGLPTNVTSGLGTITPTSTGTINDLDSLPFPNTVGFAGFMTFGGIALDLAFLGPGDVHNCDTNPGLGNSCSIVLAPGVISPFVLTQDNGGTAVSLTARGTTLDTTDNITSFWNGAFTTQLNGVTPAQVQATILGGGSITNTYSGTFNIVVPEPVSMVLIGGGLIALAAFKRRRRA